MAQRDIGRRAWGRASGGVAMLALLLLQACGGGGGTGSNAPSGGTVEARNVSVAAAETEGPVILVRAKATLAGGLGAQMDVRVNGQVVGSQTVSNVGSFQDYSFALAAPLAAGAKVDVVFTNDAVLTVNGVKEDRNLFVESVTINGSTLEAFNATLDVGSGAAAFDGNTTMTGRVVIPWNAALRFVVPAAPAASVGKVTVRASATLAGGTGALMVLRVDGQILGSVYVNNVGTAQDYNFNSPTAIAPGAKIDVVFLNDAVITNAAGAREDRNLIVDSVTVDGGTPMKPTDPGVVIDQGTGASAFDGSATVPGQRGVWWNGALRFQTVSDSLNELAIESILNKPARPEDFVSLGDGSFIVKQQLIVSFSSNATPLKVKNLVEGMGGKIVGEIPFAGVYQVEVNGVSALEKLAQLKIEFESNSLIDSVSYNFKSDVSASVALPNDTGYAKQKWATQAVNAEKAWEYLKSEKISASPVKIGVVDTGFQSSLDIRFHGLFGLDGAENGEGARPNALSSETDINQKVRDLGDFHHGMHVAGTIAANHNNSRGITGAIGAVPVDLYGARYDGSLMTGMSQVARLIVRDVKVINLSWGEVTQQSAIQASRTFGGLIEKLARRKDFLVVAAAGNSEKPADQEGLFGSIFVQDWVDYSRYENARSHIIIVGAVDGRLQFAEYSNYGAPVQILAPGGGRACGVFGSGVDRGLKVYEQNFSLSQVVAFYDDPSFFSDLSEANAFNVADFWANAENSLLAAKCSLSFEKQGVLSLGYNAESIYMSGTSMAAPFVSAAAAMAYAVNPNLSSAQVKNLLVESGSKNSIKREKDGSTYPLLDMEKVVKGARWMAGVNNVTELFKWKDEPDLGVVIISHFQCKAGADTRDVVSAPVLIYPSTDNSVHLEGSQTETDGGGFHFADIDRFTLNKYPMVTYIIQFLRTENNPGFIKGFKISGILDSLRVRSLDITVNVKNLSQCGDAASKDIAIKPFGLDMVELGNETSNSKLPHTGIKSTQCFQAGSDLLVNCSSPEAIALSGAGKQDGMYTNVSPMSYSLVPSPAGGSYDKTQCLKDNVTGLIWEGKTSDGSIRDGNSIFSRRSGQPDSINAYVDYVNRIALCGRTSWRMPDDSELMALMDYSKVFPALKLDSGWFVNSSKVLHWGTPDLYPVRLVDFWHGGAYYGADDSTDIDRFLRLPLRLISDD